MSNLSDVDLVKMAREGDERATGELIDRCKDVKDYHLQKYKRMYFGKLNQFDVEDLVSECHLAILESIRMYDLTVPHTFATYAKYAMRNRIINFLSRKVAKHLHNVVDDFDLTKLESYDSKSPLSDLIETKLDGRERDIIELYVEGHSQVEIAQKFKLSKVRIGQIIKSCIERMK